MHKVALLLISLLMTASCSIQSFRSISQKIKSNSEKLNPQLARKSHSVRMSLYKSGKLNFLGHEADTIWILESQLIESGIALGKIWNKNGSVEYSIQNDKIDFEQYRPFTSYICNLIENWDTIAIKTEERNQQPLLHAKYIFATRIIKGSTGAKIDSISFVELFKWEREVTH